MTALRFNLIAVICFGCIAYLIGASIGYFLSFFCSHFLMILFLAAGTCLVTSPGKATRYYLCYQSVSFSTRLLRKSECLNSLKMRAGVAFFLSSVRLTAFGPFFLEW